MMASKNIVVVFGATGKQGGSVVTSILSDPRTAERFSIRGVTRDPSKPAAKALVERGVEVVIADMSVKASLREALKNAYAVFLVTDFWAHVDAQLEELQGKNVVHVANVVDNDITLNIDLAHSGVIGTQYPASDLQQSPERHEALDKVVHWDSKAHIEELIRELNIPATFFLAGAYMNLFTPMTFFRPSPDPPHTFAAAFPVPTTAPVFPLLDTDSDSGKFVKAILLHRDQLLGKRILGATGWWSLEQMMREFEEVKPRDGRGAKAIEVSADTFKGMVSAAGMPQVMQDDMCQNLQMMVEYGYFNGASMEESHAILDEPLTSWKEYIAKEKAFAAFE